MGSTFKEALAVERKSKLYSHTHTYVGSSYDHKKNIKCKYCGKKGHYERKIWTNEKEKKLRKLKKKKNQKEQANTIDKKNWNDDEFISVVVLSITISD